MGTPPAWPRSEHMCNLSKGWGRDVTGGWRNRPGIIKACAVEPVSASGMKQPLAGMPEVWPQDAASHSRRGTMVTYVTWDVPLQELELHRDAMGTRYPHRQTDKSLPSVNGAQLGREKDKVAKRAGPASRRPTTEKWVLIPKRGEQRARGYGTASWSTT